MQRFDISHHSEAAEIEIWGFQTKVWLNWVRSQSSTVHNDAFVELCWKRKENLLGFALSLEISYKNEVDQATIQILVLTGP